MFHHHNLLVLRQPVSARTGPLRAEALGRARRGAADRGLRSLRREGPISFGEAYRCCMHSAAAALRRAATLVPGER